MFDRFVGYIKESRAELKKVVWPTRQETINSTVAVIVISGSVALFLGGLDFLFQFILNRFVL